MLAFGFHHVECQKDHEAQKRAYARPATKKTGVRRNIVWGQSVKEWGHTEVLPMRGTPLQMLEAAVAIVAFCVFMTVLYIAAAPSAAERCPTPSAISVESLFAPCLAGRNAREVRVNPADQWQSHFRS
jgi:hypothetical protein